MSRPLELQDDRLHPPGSAANWRESYFFGFHDQEGRAGLTYISLSPRRRVAERILFLLLPKGEHTLVCIQQDPFSRFEHAVLEEGILQYYCREPLQRWQLRAGAGCFSIPAGQEVSSALSAAGGEAAPPVRLPLAFDLRFEGRMPAYRLPDGAWDFLGQGQEHFEQMGQLSGWLRVGNEEAPFVGLGSRDRSWGVRDWLRHEWYNWINLQFGEDFFVGVVLSRVEGREAGSGFVYRDGQLLPIAQVTMEANRDHEDLHLQAATLRVVTEQGQTLDLDLAPLSFFHMIVACGNGWQNHDCFSLVTCRCQGRNGQGFAEYAQREPISPLTPEKGRLW